MSSSTQSHHKQRTNSRPSHRSTKLTFHRVTSTQNHSKLNTHKLKRSYKIFNSFSITNRDQAIVHLTVNIAPIQQTFRVSQLTLQPNPPRKQRSRSLQSSQGSSIDLPSEYINSINILYSFSNSPTMSHMNMSSSTHSLRAPSNHHTDSFSDIP